MFCLSLGTCGSKSAQPTILAVNALVLSPWGRSRNLKGKRIRAAPLDDKAVIVRACFKSYVDKDRAMIKSLISADFHFTSPLDNRIDRTADFEHCWKSATMAAADVERVVVSRDRAFVTYLGRNNGGKPFRNTELFTGRDDQVTDVEVCFGWPIPHEAPVGKFVAAK